jgi:aspartate/glutamate racemase
MTAGATLGLIGGIGPDSTIEYYRALLAAYPERHGNGTAPSIPSADDQAFIHDTRWSRARYLRYRSSASLMMTSA